MFLKKINNLISNNKKLLLFLICLSFIGVTAAFVTYIDYYVYFLDQGKWYLIPFVPISFFLYLTMFVFLCCVYFKKKIPDFLLVSTFFLNFAYGMASIIFYPLLLVYVIGFDLYYFWNIFAHGFLGILSLFVLSYLKPVKLWNYVLLFLLIFFKNYFDFFKETFTYFVSYDFGELKSLVIALIVGFQVIAFYILIRAKKIQSR